MSGKKEERKAEFTLTSDILVLDEIGRAITDISRAFKKLNDGPLTERALILLIKDQVGVNGPTRKEIEAVLEAGANLDRYLKPTEK